MLNNALFRIEEVQDMKKEEKELAGCSFAKFEFNQIRLSWFSRIKICFRNSKLKFVPSFR